MKLPFPKQKAPLGAAWDGSHLTIAGEGAVLCLPLRGPSDEAAARDRVAEKGWTGRDVVAALPASLVVFKTMRLPSTDPAELENMAVLQACRQMPFSPEDIVADVEPLESDAEGYTRALVSVARREDARAHADACRRAGLRVVRLVPAPRASAALLSRDGWLVEAGALDVTLVRVEGGHPRLVRSLPVGAASLASDAAARGRVQRDFASLISSFPATTPGIVAAGGAPIAGTALTEVVSALFPDLSPSPLGGEGRDEGWSETGVSPFPALGAATLPLTSFGLLPSEDRDGLRRSRARRRDVVTAGLAAACLVVAVVGAARSAAAKRAAIRELETRSQAVAAEVRELRRLDRLLEARRGSILGRGSLPDLLARLNAALPPSVTLLGLSYERGRGAQLQGLAPSLSQAVATVDALSSAKVFDRVEMISSNARLVQGREKTEFLVEGRWGAASRREP